MSTIEQALAKNQASKQSEQQATEKPKSAIEIAVKPEPSEPMTDPGDILASAPEKAAVISKVEHPKGEANVINLDLKKLAQNDYIVPENIEDNRILKEEFRQVKRKLLNNAFGAVASTLTHPNLIMITSARPDEGKTYIAINLALSIALEQDKTVLLVDSDVLKPSILREFGAKQRSGLIEYLLSKNKSVSDIIYHTNIDNLKIIPAGSPHHLSNELLASERMAILASELSTRYPDRIVIFDSPPLLGVTETPVLARLMGQALIAVEENKTSLNDVYQANALLHDELAKGLILNKAIHSQKELYGYYGYGYGKN